MTDDLHCQTCKKSYRPEYYDGPLDANEAFLSDHGQKLVTGTGKVETIETDPRFWNCNCKKYYIWAKRDDTFCPLCGANAEDQPDSRVGEIGRGGLFATDYSWLIAYNISEYYDSLDEIDLRKYR